MMQQQLSPQTQHARTAYDEAWFEQMFLALDTLHDAVSAQRPCKVSPVAPTDMVGWLEDIIYTAQEAIVEIRENVPGETTAEAG